MSLQELLPTPFKLSLSGYIVVTVNLLCAIARLSVCCCISCSSCRVLLELFACAQIVENLVLRVAMLYGFVECLSESAVTTLMSDVMASDVVCEVNNVQRRYPTHCDDVAVVIRQLLDKRSQVRLFCRSYRL